MIYKKNQVIRQILVGAAAHDAITSIALNIQQSLAENFKSQIFSWFDPDCSIQHKISQISVIDEGSADDVIIYHLSFGIPSLTDWLLQRPERIILWYHNVTPSHFYTNLDPEFAFGLDHGRKELEILRKKVIKVFTVSEFNAKELIDYGYEDVVVGRPSLTVQRLGNVGVESRILDVTSTRFPNGFILSVSQVLPHKRVDHAISVLHLLREYHNIDIGLVWAGPIRSTLYMNSLNLFMERLQQENVLFTDVVSEKELATLYRSCTAFMSLSQHEGLSVPPLEAMAERAPVVVRGACALPETVGSGGFVLPESWGIIEFSEVMAQVCTDSMLRSELRNLGQQWIQDYRSSSDFSEAIKIISEVAS